MKRRFGDDFENAAPRMRKILLDILAEKLYNQVAIAPIVQRIGQRFPEPLIRVRFLFGAPGTTSPIHPAIKAG
jgi:hypothetical protein